MGTGIMIFAIFLLMFIGVPIGISIGAGILVLLAVNPVTSVEFVAQSLYSGLESYTLVALPFFIMAGTIMEAGGISKRLVNAANSIVGNITGNLGMVAIISCMFFGAVSGSAMATVAAIGSIMIPVMVKEGYSKEYSTALVAVSGALGMIIPPSTALVIYGVTNSVSIGALFMSGFLPGVLLGGLLMVCNYVISKRRGYVPKNKEKYSFIRMLKTFWNAKWALLMPVIILGGIYSGVFTPTESAVIACVYGLIVGLLIHKELSWGGIWRIYKTNTSFLGGLMFTFAPAASLSAMLAYLKVPVLVFNFFSQISTNPLVILFVIFVFLFIAGMFLEVTPSIMLFSPILFPIVTELGVNPIHFGIFITMSLTLGLSTPPVAPSLFVAQSMTGLGMLTIAKEGIPFIIASIIAALVVMLIPSISLLLPQLFNFM